MLTYYHSFPQLNDQLQYEWAELDTHDSLTDFYKHLRSVRSIRATLQALGARDVWVQRAASESRRVVRSRTMDLKIKALLSGIVDVHSLV